MSTKPPSGERPPGSAGTSAVTPVLIAVLAFVGAIGPLSIDMYLPGFPELADDFGTGASTIQVTLTAFLLGAATGQFLLGPLSDQWGRRRLLVGGLVLAAAAGVACVFAPGVWWLVVARALQGFGASAGMVLGRAVVADLTSGSEGIRVFSTLMAVQAIGPVVAPLLGGVLVGAIGWRGIFAVLAVLTAAMTLAVVLRVPESLPPERRSAAGAAALASNARTVLGNRRFVALTLAYTSSFAVMFAYISGSSFVMQNGMGFSPAAYSTMFTVNAAGLFAANVVNARLARRVDPLRMLTIGVAWLASTAVALAVVVLGLGGPTVPVLILFFSLFSSIGLVFSNGAGLALQAAAPLAGTGSAVMGALQFGLAAIAAPVVGVAGRESATPMVLVMLLGSGVAVVSLLVARGETARHRATVGP